MHGQCLQSCVHRRDAYTLDMLEIPQGAGSGLIWDASGHIVTNYHVIRGASELQVVITLLPARIAVDVYSSMQTSVS